MIGIFILAGVQALAWVCQTKVWTPVNDWNIGITYNEHSNPLRSNRLVSASISSADWL
jgi:hypothetical protein